MAAIAERPLEIFLAEHALLGEGGLDPFAPVGKLSIAENSFAILIIRFAEEKLLVAVPHKAWHRRAQNRLLPAGSLTKPLSLQVSVCLEDSRDQAAPENCKLWVGFLHRDYWQFVDFPEEAFEVDHNFTILDSSEICIPFGEALQAIQEDKFPSPLTEPGGAHESDRLTALEAQMASLKSGMDLLLARRTPLKEDVESGFVTADAAEDVAAPPGLMAPRPKRPPALKPPTRTQYAGLDPGTVAAAVQAGVPAEHLEAMSKLVMEKPAKMGDVPRVTLPATPYNVLDDDAEEPEEVAELPDGAPASSDPVAQAIVTLTSIVKSISQTSKKNQSLEDTLDAASGQALNSEQPGVSGKKHIKALEALRKALKSEPHLIYKSVEKLMEEDYALMGSLPNTGASSMTGRGWAEHRSRILGYPRAVRTTWSVAGVLDCLRAGAHEEARARCCLILCQMEQEAIDRGNFVVAAEMALEPAPPYASFANHVLPDQMEAPFTRIMDPRWVDSMVSKVKDADEYLEKRRKLGQKGNSQKAEGSEETTQPIVKPKGKQKGKGKGNSAKGDAEGAES